MSDEQPQEVKITPAEKVKQFPLTPGVYLMKDEQGRVLLLYRQGEEALRHRATH